MNNVYDCTNELETKLAEYTGAPYAVCLDNCSNAIFLSLMYEGVKGKEIEIPNRTYPSVPCEIIHAGAKIKWKKLKCMTIVLFSKGYPVEIKKNKLIKNIDKLKLNDNQANPK